MAELTHLSSLQRWSVAMIVSGPQEQIDAHLIWVQETAALGEWEVTVEVQPSNTAGISAQITAVFETETQIDAVLMAIGLCKPLDGDHPGIVMERGLVTRL